jgi:hypothetical protein
MHAKKPLVVAVIDTGFGSELSTATQAIKDVKLCKFGHKNFVDEKDTSDKFGTHDPVPVDTHGHGTNIAGIIDAYGKAENVDFCLVILKYYSPKSNESLNLINTIKAIEYARQIHADFINYSGGGLSALPEEIAAVQKYINKGGTFVAAAGNERHDINMNGYYPAQDDDRVIVVGNAKVVDEKIEKLTLETPVKKGLKTYVMDKKGVQYLLESSSNYGTRVDRYEDGENVLALGLRMTGTSQATAIATGKLLLEKTAKKKILKKSK